MPKAVPNYRKILEARKGHLADAPPPRAQDNGAAKVAKPARKIVTAETKPWSLVDLEEEVLGACLAAAMDVDEPGSDSVMVEVSTQTAAVAVMRDAATQTVYIKPPPVHVPNLDGLDVALAAMARIAVRRRAT